MMKKIMFLMLWLPVVPSTVKATGPQKAASKVEKVMVFFSRSGLTRKATLRVGKVESIITFYVLSPDIDAQSIPVHADGTFILMSEKNELNFLDRQVKQKNVYATDSKVQWNLNLAQSEDKKFELRYRVKELKNQQVILL